MLNYLLNFCLLIELYRLMFDRKCSKPLLQYVCMYVFCAEMSVYINLIYKEMYYKVYFCLFTYFEIIHIISILILYKHIN